MSVIFNAPITPKTSYGISAINIIDFLEKEGCEVEAIPINNQAEYFTNQDIRSSLERGMFFNREHPCIRFYHEFSLSERHGKGPHVGFPIFEKTTFSKQEIHQLNQPDILFVPTNWAKQVIEENGIKTDTRVVNLGVNHSVFYPTNPERDDVFTFFFPGKFEVRKSFDICMDIFEDAFNVTDNIRIIFLPTNIHIGEENRKWAEYLMSSSLASKILLLNPVDSPEQVAEIYNRCDCIVSFSRAEGWNLPLIEGMACGKQIIATNYSAHTEYLTSENSYAVDVDGLVEAYDGKWFVNPENKWADIGNKCKSLLAECLRTVYKNGKKVNYAGIETAKRLGWDNTAKSIIRELSLE